jgi:cell division protein FtsB
MPRHRPSPEGGSPFRFPKLPSRQSGAIAISVVMVVISCWMLFGIIGQVITGSQLERQRAEAQADLARIESENARLQGEVQFAESPAYAEQVAREQLGMARDGDTVILPTFPDVTPTAILPTPEPLPAVTPQPNWRGWQRALFP